MVKDAFLNVVSDIVAFYPDQNRYDILATNAAGPIVPSPDNQKFAITVQNNGHLAVDMIDITGKNRRRLLEGATSVEKVIWSPDSATIAAVWSADIAVESHKLHLTWMPADASSAPFTINDSFTTIEQIWWLDHDWMLFTAKQREGLGLKVADLMARSHFTLLSGVVEDLPTGESANHISPFAK